MTDRSTELIQKSAESALSAEEATALIGAQGPAMLDLLRAACVLRDEAKGNRVTYSRKVFIPLTTLCRDDCGYCTFKRDPGQPGAKTLSPEEVLDIARRGKARGCKEALFSLGDKPELRFPEAAADLAHFGYKTTTDYLVAMCRLVLEETGLLPHPNPGTLGRHDLARLREVSPSMGVMLENVSPRMRQPGMAHEHAPDKIPGARVAMVRMAGELRIPFTTGLLIGIGETPRERVDTLLEIKRLQEAHGHIQEVIVQNFRAKPAIPMADWPDATLMELLRTIAVARLLLGGEMNIQAPPNLSPEVYPLLLLAGINDWGGVSPVTPDHINPEAPWPEIQRLAQFSADAGYTLRERLCVYPEYIDRKPGFLSDGLRDVVLRQADGEGYALAEEKYA